MIGELFRNYDGQHGTELQNGAGMSASCLPYPSILPPNDRRSAKVTGEASSFGRRALMAGVSHAGELVQPMSLSSAIDITPPSAIDEEDAAQENSGPLASVALIEQAKQAGATKQV